MVAACGGLLMNHVVSHFITLVYLRYTGLLLSSVKGHTLDLYFGVIQSVISPYSEIII